MGWQVLPIWTDVTIVRPAENPDLCSVKLALWVREELSETMLY